MNAEIQALRRDATRFAVMRGDAEVNVMHLLAALATKNNSAMDALVACDASFTQLEKSIGRNLGPACASAAGVTQLPKPTEAFERVMQTAACEVSTLGRTPNDITGKDILLALFTGEENKQAVSSLRLAGVLKSELRGDSERTIAHEWVLAMRDILWPGPSTRFERVVDWLIDHAPDEWRSRFLIGPKRKANHSKPDSVA